MSDKSEELVTVSRIGRSFKRECVNPTNKRSIGLGVAKSDKVILKMVNAMTAKTYLNYKKEYDPNSGGLYGKN